MLKKQSSKEKNNKKPKEWDAKKWAKKFETKFQSLKNKDFDKWLRD
jgi:hypothetical protein